MTVDELIAELQTVPGNTKVLLTTNGFGFNDIEFVEFQKNITERETDKTFSAVVLG